MTTRERPVRHAQQPARQALDPAGSSRIGAFTLIASADIHAAIKVLFDIRAAAGEGGSLLAFDLEVPDGTLRLRVYLVGGGLFGPTELTISNSP